MIGYVGLSHLGIVSSLAAASKGFEVVGYDADDQLCVDLQNGIFPIVEPGLADLWTKHRQAIRFTSDRSALAACQLVFLSLDMPTDQENRSQLQVVDQVIRQVAPDLSLGAVLVILCQVPPGFTRSLQQNMRTELAEKQITLYYQVETLIFGVAVERALRPERYIVGCADPATSLPGPYLEMLESFACPILPMRYESAELAKISINMCLVASVSVTNTLAELCEAVGADWYEIAPALKLDKRIGPHAYLAPGLGIAGGNLERDLVTVTKLAAEHGTDAGIVDAFFANSHHRRQWALRVVRQLDITSLAIWGLAYKAHTHSTKNSPALALIKDLNEFSVRAYDPQVILDRGSDHFVQCATALDACDGAAALIIMTPWPEFSEAGLSEVRERMDGDVIIDPYRVLDHSELSHLGFKLVTLGK